MIPVCCLGFLNTLCVRGNSTITPSRHNNSHSTGIKRNGNQGLFGIVLITRDFVITFIFQLFYFDFGFCCVWTCNIICLYIFIYWCHVYLCYHCAMKHIKFQIKQILEAVLEEYTKVTIKILRKACLSISNLYYATFLNVVKNPRNPNMAFFSHGYID